MSTAIRRGFVHLAHGELHYRIAGRGPALLMLHQSPQSSRMWVELMPRFAARCTVVAPDTPGFGLSDPLPLAAPRIADLARALLDFAAALGLERFAVFGMHTGALIAVEMGLHAPERVAAVLADGYPCFSDAEREVLGERYLPPFVPRWDGGHLAWLWARMREQVFYFPWYDGRAECALAYPAPTPEQTHAAVMDILEVGDGYRAGYRAALEHADGARVARLRMPTWLFYRDDDVLLGHRERLPPLAAPVRCERVTGGKPALHARIEAVLAEVLAVEPEPASAGPPASGPDWRRALLQTPHGALCAWHAGSEGPLHLRLHAVGSAPPRPLAAAPRENRLLAPDLPGHGGSGEWAGPLEAGALAESLVAAVEACAARAPVRLEAHGASWGLALALAARLGARVSALELHTPWLLEPAEIDQLLAALPDPALQRAGGHLLEAWQWTRDARLFPPWAAASAANRQRIAAPDPVAVHADAVEVIRLGPRLRPLLAAALGRDWHAKLSALACPIEIHAAHPLLAGRGPGATQGTLS